MKYFITIILFCCTGLFANAQPAKTELFDLLKKLISDSTGYPSVGEWDLGDPKYLSIKWQPDGVQMSDDTSINFYRMGSASITIKGKMLIHAAKPVKWNIMLKGPRMGYTSFSIVSTPTTELTSKFTIDSVLGKKPFTAKLLKTCDSKILSGFYYYELKIPKKDILFIKIGWLSINGNTAMRIDGYYNGSNYAAKLDCPK